MYTYDPTFQFSSDLSLNTGFKNYRTSQQIRSLLEDVPDEEILAYGTTKQIHEAFDGDCDETDAETLQTAKNFTDMTWENILTNEDIEIVQLYWDFDVCQYVLNFN